ncbi:hypothetical protein QUA13_30285 [Microcoleus sp. S28C3]
MKPYLEGFPHGLALMIRKFVRWATDEGRVSAEDADAARRVFAQFGNEK